MGTFAAHYRKWMGPQSVQLIYFQHVKRAFLLFFPLLMAASGASGQILIGEVDAYGTLTDVLGQEEDWIEL